MDYPDLLPGDINFPLGLKADQPGCIIVHGEEVSWLLIDHHLGNMPQLTFQGKPVQRFGSKLTLTSIE